MSNNEVIKINVFRFVNSETIPMTYVRSTKTKHVLMGPTGEYHFRKDGTQVGCSNRNQAYKILPGSLTLLRGR